jgi:hypothetical protein
MLSPEGSAVQCSAVGSYRRIVVGDLLGKVYESVLDMLKRVLKRV